MSYKRCHWWMVMVLLSECSQCVVTIILNGLQSTLEFGRFDLKTFDPVRLPVT